MSDEKNYKNEKNNHKNNKNNDNEINNDNKCLQRIFFTNKPLKKITFMTLQYIQKGPNHYSDLDVCGMRNTCKICK